MAGTPPRGSDPDPDRPRLSPELERQLEPVDRKSAQGYAAVELAIEKIDKLLEDGAVLATIDPTDSLVHSLRKVTE